MNKRPKLITFAFRRILAILPFLAAEGKKEMGDDAATAAILEDARGLAAQLAPAHRRAPMPRNLRRDDLPRINPAEYVCAPKTDGTRVTLVLGATQADDKEYVVVFDRAGRGRVLDVGAGVVAELKTLLPRADGGDAFCGTLLEAEELDTGELIVFDAVTVAGYDVRARTFQGRLNAAAPVVEAFGRGAALKTWHPVTSCVEAHAAPGPPRDGVIFQHKHTAHGAMPIYKFKETHTLDFLFDADAWWFGDGAARARVAALGIRIEVGAAAPTAGVVYECAPAADDACRFTVLGARRDKTAPNQRVTVESTLVSIGEKLTLHELQAHFRRHVEDEEGERCAAKRARKKK